MWYNIIRNKKQERSAGINSSSKKFVSKEVWIFLLKKIMNHVIGVDTGNKCIKTVNHIFVSGVKSHVNKPAISDEILEYKNVYYTLTSERVAYLQDKTETEEYFILTLFAIAKEMITRGIVGAPVAHIDLAVGLPPSHLSRLKESFTKYFRKSFVAFKYNDKDFLVSVDNVKTFPQGYAAIIPSYSDIRKIPKSYIVDIGGYTTDVILLKNGIPDMSYCESLNFGVIELYNRIQRQIAAEFGRSPDEAQIDAYWETGEEIYKTMGKTIQRETEGYVDEILRKLQEHGVDLVPSHAILIGGGAIKLKRYLEDSQYLASRTYIDSIKANAIGYEALAANLS